MRNQERSWWYFGLLALALTAGAIRFGEDAREYRGPAAIALPQQTPPPLSDPAICEKRLDPAWFGECLPSPPRLLAEQ
jgi:hypothetical protein